MDTLGFTIKAQMPNAKVVGPPQAGAFKERKSGKFFYWSIRRLPSDTHLTPSGLSPSEL